ncbi:hypothetical protein KY285_014002 [Solanum tuberosum]|nr:hypothetical protein KY285_014002 [Solanum tuberosum]
MGVKFDEEIQGLWLLNTLPDSFGTLQVSLTNSAPSGVVTMKYAKSGVLNEEMGRRIQGSSFSTSHSNVVVTEDMGRSKFRGQNDRDKSRGKSKFRFKNVTCDYCHKNGHIKKYCFKYKRDMKQQKKEGDNENRVVVVANDDLLVSCDEMSSILFAMSLVGNFGMLKMGKNYEVAVLSIRTVCLESNNGSKLVLNNVKHAPDVRLNLIYVRYLDDEGYVNTLGAGQWKLTKGSMVVARGDKLSNLYVFQGSILRGSVNVVENDTSSLLWNRRLNHMSEKGMDNLAKKNLLFGVKQEKLNKCVHCLADKQKRVRSHSGALYFMTFIDDYSRKLWVFSLKFKDQVLDVFKSFQVLVERQTKKKLKCICSDNGGEYIGPFDRYCREQNIQHQKTPPKTLQLNGLVERMNRTLVERAEALNTVAYVINLSPTVALNGDDPDRVWSGKNVSYDRLKVFRCKAFVHVSKDERSKLDAKTRQCILVGYGQDEFNYRFFNPVEKKLVKSRDVVFFEDQTIEDLDKVKKVDSQNSESLVDVDPVPLTIPPGENLQVDIEDGDHIQNDQYIVDAPVQDNVVGENQRVLMRPWKVKKKKDDRKALKNRWVFRVKHEDGNPIPWYKPKVVVKGFSQKREIDFDEIFSPVVKMSSICVPEGFKVKGKENYVCKLKNSLYGLKQALRQWYSKFGSFMSQQGFKKTSSDHCVFVQKISDDDFIIVLLYVDDMMLVVGHNTCRIKKLKQELNKSFAMKDLEPARQIIGMQIVRDRYAKKLWLSQEKYIQKNMKKVPYDSVVGSLMYTMMCQRSDIAHVVGKPILYGYTDSDMAGDVDTQAELIVDVEACKEFI